MILSGFKPEVKGLFPSTSALRGHPYLLESRARHAPRISHPQAFLEIRPSHPAILYNTPRPTAGSMKHNGLVSALPRPFLVRHTRTSAKRVLGCSQNAISSSMHPPRYCVYGSLTTAILAHTSKNTTSPFNAPMPMVAASALGTRKTFHAIVTPNIRQQRSGTARMRLASTREGGKRSSRGKTTSTDTSGPCTVKRTSFHISPIPIHVVDCSH